MPAIDVSAGNLMLAVAGYNFAKPLWMVAVGVGLSLGLLYLVYLLLTLTFPKVAAIARTTAKEAIYSPLFGVEVVAGIVIISILAVLPFYTFGDDIKMFKESIVEIILVLAAFLAIWSVGVSITDELEGRTALTLLSKPVGRRQLLLGKFLGVLGAVLLLFVILGAYFVTAVSFRLSYDAREAVIPEPSVAQHKLEMMSVLPGLILAFMATMVLTSITVALSTRLPWLPNLTIMVSIYLVGRLVPLLVQSSVGKFAVVTFIGQFLATVLPVLEYFNVAAATTRNQVVPLDYLVWAGLYSLLYSGIALLVTLLLFEDRDLA